MYFCSQFRSIWRMEKWSERLLLPRRSRLFGYLDLWSYDGTLDCIHHALFMACREQGERDAGRARRSSEKLGRERMQVEPGVLAPIAVSETTTLRRGPERRDEVGKLRATPCRHFCGRARDEPTEQAHLPLTLSHWLFKGGGAKEPHFIAAPRFCRSRRTVCSGIFEAIDRQTDTTTTDG
jgi:hypothetical protein